jgi:hypothetical protein
VGVTGHRILADTELIDQGIERALGTLARMVPGRPIRVRSALAEGADRLVAAAGLRLPGSTLEVVLPLEESDFERDFAKPESKAAFRNLLSKAAERRVVELPAGSSREQAYLAGGLAMLEGLDALVVVWDGQAAHGPGGTGNIVARARERGVPVAWVHAGNRLPGTTEATALGATQGTVTYERLERLLGRRLPYRVRLAVVGGPLSGDSSRLRATIRRELADQIRSLLDDASLAKLANSQATPMAFSALLASESDGARLVAEEVAATPLGLVEAASARAPNEAVDRGDVVVTLGAAPGDPVLRYARQRGRPVIEISTEPVSPITVSRGHGLNAQSIGGLEAFNRRADRSGDLRPYVENKFKEDFPPDQAARIPTDLKAAVRNTLHPYYVLASDIAKKNQGDYRQAGRMVWILAPLAVAAVATGVLVPALAKPAFLTELVILVAILWFAVQAHRRRSLDRWVEHRFLAERIRSAVHLAACGVEPGIVEIPPFIGRPHPHAWPLMGFSEIWNRMPPLKALTADSWPALRQYAKKVWLDPQVHHHTEKHKSSAWRATCLEWVGWAAIALAVVTATAHLLMGGHHAEPSALERALSFLSFVLPGIGAAAGGFRAHREYSRLAKRSESMSATIQELSDRLDAASSAEEFTRILQEAERAMLLEAQDWLVLMQFAVVEAHA